jgi:hypothetical protein
MSASPLVVAVLATMFGLGELGERHFRPVVLCFLDQFDR